MKLAIFSLVAILTSASNASVPQKRATDDISSCGPDWMPVSDISTNNGQIKRRGFNTAVDYFCDKAHGQTLGGQLYLSMATRVFINFGGDPTKHGINGYVYFEIHNKLNADHKVDGSKCKQYLKALSKEGGKCYGRNNKDTKGGTWQVGKEEVSYHALANEVPPTSDAVDKTIILKEEIKPLSRNYNVPNPFPYFSFTDVVPVGCHSHNDYERSIALYSALSAGCVSAEVDVWHRNGNLIVSHTSPVLTERKTITDLYIDPLKTLLGGAQTVFPRKPSQDLSLLVDFKTGGDDTWNALVKALAPLRERGWLSHYDGRSFQRGNITVIVSGDAPFNRVIDDTSNPGRAIFFDASIQSDLKDRDTSNTYLASGNFGDAVGNLNSGLQKLRSQVKAAHDKGFRVRYWAGPTEESQMQKLVDECVDRVNVDDLRKMASLDWKLNGGSCTL